MIAAAALAIFAFHRDGESVTLRRSYMPGDNDSYALRISPPGQPTPLDNSSQVSVHVGNDRVVSIVGEPSTYRTEPQVLAKWRPADQGNVGEVQAAVPGFAFLPFVFTVNDSKLAPGEIEAVEGGSVKLISVKDSVAQLQVWVQVTPTVWLSERSDVEVATRKPNQIHGTLFSKGKQGLIPVRTFVLQRIRTGEIVPIPQEGGG